ncbi:MAG: DUF4890 domain-containing protein [Cytophagales bacterium]|nr:DUF4890 domain-containing protein [Cytophagales bacterium]
MKTIKSIFITTSIAVMTWINNVHGQPNFVPGTKPDPQKMAQMQTDMMSKDLALNTDQKKKLSELNLKFAKEMEQKMKPYEETLQKVHSMIEEQKQQMENELKSLLSAEQWAKFQKLKARMEENIPRFEK